MYALKNNPSSVLINLQVSFNEQQIRHDLLADLLAGRILRNARCAYVCVLCVRFECTAAWFKIGSVSTALLSLLTVIFARRRAVDAAAAAAATEGAAAVADSTEAAAASPGVSFHALSPPTTSSASTLSTLFPMPGHSSTSTLSTAVNATSPPPGTLASCVLSRAVVGNHSAAQLDTATLSHQPSTPCETATTSTSPQSTRRVVTQDGALPNTLRVLTLRRPLVPTFRATGTVTLGRGISSLASTHSPAFSRLAALTHCTSTHAAAATPQTAATQSRLGDLRFGDTPKPEVSDVSSSADDSALGPCEARSVATPLPAPAQPATPLSQLGDLRFENSASVSVVTSSDVEEADAEHDGPEDGVDPLVDTLEQLHDDRVARALRGPFGALAV